MPRPPEPWIERKIREAAEAGAFDGLEGAGNPIPDIDYPYDAAWWARRWIRRHRDLDAVSAVAAEVQRALPRVLAGADETDVVAGLEGLNDRIGAVNATVPSESRLDTLPVPALVDPWRRRRSRGSRRVH